MNSFSLNNDHRVTIVHGQDLNPALYGFTEFIPGCKDYVLCMVPSLRNQKSFKVFECLVKEHGTQVQCGVVMTNMRRFFYHMLTHTKERPYVCQEEGCGWAFSQKINLERHIESTHGEQKMYQCSHCNKKYSTNSNLKKHIIKFHYR